MLSLSFSFRFIDISIVFAIFISLRHQISHTLD
jgi:hypothetical protein